MADFLSANFSSHLKEGERVCGGRGQFGNQPLWNLNAIPKLRIAGGSADGCKCDALGSVSRTGYAASDRQWLPEAVECLRAGEAEHTYPVQAGGFDEFAASCERLRTVKANAQIHYRVEFNCSEAS
jgi:hypothetical protein